MTIDKQPKSKLQDILMMIVLMLRAMMIMMMMMTMMNAYKSTIQMKYNLQLCMKSNSILTYSLMKRNMNSKIDYHK